MLRPASHLRGDAGSREVLAHDAYHLVDHLLARRTLLVEEPGDALVSGRVRQSEGEVFHLPLELPDAQPVGQRREQVERHPRVALAQCLVGMAGERAQGHQFLGQLDQHGADVLHHRQQHLAQGLLLGRRGAGLANLGQRLDRIEPRRALDQRQHLRPGALAQRFARVAAVERQPGEQRSQAAGRIGADRGQDLCDIECGRRPERPDRQPQVAIAQRSPGQRRLDLRTRDRREAALLAQQGGGVQCPVVGRRLRWLDQFVGGHVAIIPPALHRLGPEGARAPLPPTG